MSDRLPPGRFRWYHLCCAVYLEYSYLIARACDMDASGTKVGSREDWFSHHLAGRRSLAFAGLLEWSKV